MIDRYQDPLLANHAGNDFTLSAKSPCIDSAGPLTTTAGAGSGTLIAVEDAGYFCDTQGFAAGS